MRREGDWLARYSQTHPDVVVLGSLASLARRIEPELLRRLRLKFASSFSGSARPSVGTEGALWFSPLVETRGPDSITLLPEVSQALRVKLAALGLVDACHALLQDCHLHVPPVIRWEEDLIYLGVTARWSEAEVGDRIRALTLQAVKAIAGGERAGLERWIGEMWARLPPTTARHSLLGRLRLSVDSRREAELEQSSALAAPPLEVRVLGNVLQLGALAGAGDYSLTAPGSNHWLFEVDDTAGRRQTVVVPHREKTERVGWDYPLRIRTTSHEYLLERPTSVEEVTEAVRRLEGHDGAVWCVAVSRDGRFAFTGSEDGTVRHWDLGSVRCLATFKRHTGRVLAVAVSPDARGVASGGHDGVIRIWDAETGEVRRMLEGHTGEVNALAFFPDGSRLVSVSDDGTLRMWDVATGVCDRMLQRSAPLLDVVVFPAGDKIAAIRADRWFLVCQEESLSITLESPLGRPARSVTASPDGKSIAVGFHDGTVSLYDVASDSLRATLEGHTAPVYGLSLTPDGTRLVSASGDGTLRCWDLSTGALLSTQSGASELVGLALASDGRFAVTGGNGRTAFVWDVAAQDRNLVRERWPRFNGRRVFVVGTGHNELSNAEIWMSEALGRALARSGFELIGAGGRGVAEVIARTYVSMTRSLDGSEGQLVQWLTSGEPVFDAGQVFPIPPDVDVRQVALQRADVAVLIGGSAGTLFAFEEALAQKKPVLPVPGTGGSAFEVYQRLRHSRELGALDKPISSLADAESLAERLISMLGDRQMLSALLEEQPERRSLLDIVVHLPAPERDLLVGVFFPSIKNLVRVSFDLQTRAEQYLAILPSSVKVFEDQLRDLREAVDLYFKAWSRVQEQKLDFQATLHTLGRLELTTLQESASTLSSRALSFPRHFDLPEQVDTADFTRQHIRLQRTWREYRTVLESELQQASAQLKEFDSLVEQQARTHRVHSPDISATVQRALELLNRYREQLLGLSAAIGDMLEAGFSALESTLSAVWKMAPWIAGMNEAYVPIEEQSLLLRYRLLEAADEGAQALRIVAAVKLAEEFQWHEVRPQLNSLLSHVIPLVYGDTDPDTLLALSRHEGDWRKLVKTLERGNERLAVANAG